MEDPEYVRQSTDRQPRVIQGEWFISRNACGITCWNIDRSGSGNADRMPAGVCRFIPRRTLRRGSQWNRPRFKLNPRWRGSYRTDDGCRGFGKHQTLKRKREKEGWLNDDIKTGRLREEAQSLEFRQDGAARRRRIFTMAGLIRALSAPMAFYTFTMRAIPLLCITIIQHPERT